MAGWRSRSSKERSVRFGSKSIPRCRCGRRKSCTCSTLTTPADVRRRSRPSADPSGSRSPVGRGAVRLDLKDNEMYLGLPEKAKSSALSPGQAELPTVFAQLVTAIRDLAAKGNKDGFVSYSAVNQLLMDRKVDYRKAEYKQFKKFVTAAEKRGFVESRSDGQQWFVKASEEA